MSNQQVKLPSATELVILELLAGKEMYGLEMVKASPRLNRNTIYVFLMRMEESKVVKSRLANLNERTLGRRIYSLTGLGQEVLQAAREIQTIRGQLGGLMA